MELQRPTGSLAGRWHGVPLRFLAPHRWPGQSGPNRQGAPFSRLPFVMVKFPPHMGFYYTQFGLVWLGAGVLVNGLGLCPAELDWQSPFGKFLLSMFSFVDSKTCRPILGNKWNRLQCTGDHEQVFIL